MSGCDIRIQTMGEIERPLVRLGDVGAWSMVRRSDFRNAAPFVISRKEWDRLPLLGGTGETL